MKIIGISIRINLATEQVMLHFSEAVWQWSIRKPSDFDIEPVMKLSKKIGTEWNENTTAIVMKKDATGNYWAKHQSWSTGSSTKTSMFEYLIICHN